MDSDREDTPLLSRTRDGDAHTFPQSISSTRILRSSATRVLPLAFLSALAMSATAATAHYAYVLLLCTDPTHCGEEESRRYARYMAVVTTVSNLLGIIAIGPLEKVIRRKKHVGIVIWLSVRSMGVFMLLLGCKIILSCLEWLEV